MPHVDQAFGIEDKLRRYSLAPHHERNRGKANGFAVRLGIELDSIDYLEAEIRTGVSRVPICSVRPNPPYGLNCVVDFEITGRGNYSGRQARLRTIWELVDGQSRLRLINALLK